MEGRSFISWSLQRNKLSLRSYSQYHAHMLVNQPRNTLITCRGNEREITQRYSCRTEEQRATKHFAVCKVFAGRFVSELSEFTVRYAAVTGFNLWGGHVGFWGWNRWGFSGFFGQLGRLSRHGVIIQLDVQLNRIGLGFLWRGLVVLVFPLFSCLCFLCHFGVWTRIYSLFVVISYQTPSLPSDKAHS